MNFNDLVHLEGASIGRNFLTSVEYLQLAVRLSVSETLKLLTINGHLSPQTDGSSLKYFAGMSTAVNYDHLSDEVKDLDFSCQCNLVEDRELVDTATPEVKRSW